MTEQQIKMQEKPPKPKTKFQTFTEYILIIAGTILLSIGVYFFKIPNGFSTGGVSGISTILGKLIPIISSATWLGLINVSLLVISLFVLGKMNSFRTVFCSLLFSGITYIFERIFPLTEPMTDQPLLELVYAMLLTSVGSAIIFNCNASSGGTDIIALIFKKYTKLDVGKSLLITDFFIAASSFYAFGIKAGLFSMLGLFAKAFLVDSIIENINSFKYFIVITEKEKESVEVVDWGLDMLETMGLEIITYINTDRVCAKEMVLIPGQTCAEHWHVPTNGIPGKEETFRCRYGQVYLYVEGEKNVDEIKATLPKSVVSVFHEVILNPGDQYTIMPGVKHWFQGGPDGAVISEFSTKSTDETDQFTDKNLIRSGSLEE